MEEQLELWNEFYQNHKEIHFDNWLEKYLKFFPEPAAGTKGRGSLIIDLGCGNGGNANYLYNKNYSVLACDYSTEALDNVKKLNGNIETKMLDLRGPLPFTDGEVSVVVADLSLHYFSSETTKKIVTELNRIVKTAGYLLVRVNSVNDINFGAGKGEEIERGYYYNKGNYKRFFDREMIDEYFQDSRWDMIYKNEYDITRYGDHKKAVWEVVLKKTTTSP
jgi:SAM-dependent methyltransferase